MFAVVRVYFMFEFSYIVNLSPSQNIVKSVFVTFALLFILLQNSCCYTDIVSKTDIFHKTRGNA